MKSIEDKEDAAARLGHKKPVTNARDAQTKHSTNFQSSASVWLGFDLDTNVKRSQARTWQDWANLRFKTKTAKDLDDIKERSCLKCSQRLAHLDFVLDRLLPYLVLAWGFETLEKTVMAQMYDDLTISASNPWHRAPITCSYRWIGPIEHEGRNQMPN